MGVDIGKLVNKREISLEELKGKVVGIDAYNTLYQFLSSIRGPFGEPLKDSKGNITSHLTGLFYRTLNLMEQDLRLVFVFDGKPLELKYKTQAERREIRKDAKEKLGKAIEEEARKYAQQSVTINQKMVEQAKELLGLMGLPIVEAKHDAEAQLALMEQKKAVDVVVSQDYDALLFGTERLVRNITLSGKRKLPGRNVFIDIKPEEILLSKSLNELKITREKLIWLGMLIGTDFNDKVPMVGPKKALKLVQENDSFEAISDKVEGISFDFKEIQNVFLNPSFNEDYKIEFRNLDRNGLIEYLTKYDFSKERVESRLDKIMKDVRFDSRQSSLGAWS